MGWRATEGELTRGRYSCSTARTRAQSTFTRRVVPDHFYLYLLGLPHKIGDERRRDGDEDSSRSPEEDLLSPPVGEILVMSPACTACNVVPHTAAPGQDAKLDGASANLSSSCTL